MLQWLCCAGRKCVESVGVLVAVMLRRMAGVKLHNEAAASVQYVQGCEAGAV